MTSINDEHPEKTLVPISSTLCGILISFNDVHPLKTKLPIDLTDEGIETVAREEHM